MTEWKLEQALKLRRLRHLTGEDRLIVWPEHCAVLGFKDPEEMGRSLLDPACSAGLVSKRGVDYYWAPGLRR